MEAKMKMEAEESCERISSRSNRLREAEATVRAYVEKMRMHRGPVNGTDATLLALAELILDARGA